MAEFGLGADAYICASQGALASFIAGVCGQHLHDRKGIFVGCASFVRSNSLEIGLR